MHAFVSDSHLKSSFLFFIIILHFRELPKIPWFQAGHYIFQNDQTIYVYLKLGLLLV